MTLLADEVLIDRIYEAAVVPDLWPGVLQRLTERCEGAFASLFVLGSSGIRFVGTPDGERLISEYNALGKLDFNSRIPARIAISENGFLTTSITFPVVSSKPIRFTSSSCGPGATAGSRATASGRRPESSPASASSATFRADRSSGR